jgi:hypothetical protein
MKNMLLEQVQYQTLETRWGRWRRFMYSDGRLFAEFRSHGSFLGLPLVHYTRGKSPETGRRLTAKGVVAVGRVAIGHASAGVLAIGQLGIGLVFGLGQAATGLVSVGQLAVGVLFGLAQFGTGYAVVAQFGLGEYVLAQVGYGAHLWTPETADPAAVEFFTGLPQRIHAWLFGPM